MRRIVSYSLASLFVVAVGGLVVPASWYDLSVGARPVVERGMSVQQVNRTHKADRLDIPVTVVAKKQPATTTVSKEQPQVKPAKILEGCDPVFSPLSSSAQANLPGRCLS